jgi:hypothetical protein
LTRMAATGARDLQHGLGSAATTVDNHSGHEWDYGTASGTTGRANCPAGQRGLTRHHPEDRNLKCAAAKVVRHALRPGSRPTADGEQ